MKRKARILLLLDAAERAAATPLSSRRLHAFAYLADVLSPVWNLPAFDGKILKLEGGPFYPDLQDEIDQLAVDGFLEVRNLRYVGRGRGGARVEGDYTLRYGFSALDEILRRLGAAGEVDAFDPLDFKLHDFLSELAGALATISNEGIDRAASADVTYRSGSGVNNIVDFAAWASDPWASNPSWRAAERFQSFLPPDANLSDGEKLYLYASYLGRFLNVA
jgi:hypothetical protein